MSHDGSDCFDKWDSKTGVMKPTCHLIGDVGADTYLSGRESNLDWANQTMTFPIADLSRIYKAMNITDGTGETELEACCMSMFGISVLDKYLSGVATEMLDKHASFLTDEVDWWYHSGIEDGSAHVQWKWNTVSYLLSQPPENL
jgi:hypothetical protein